MPIKIPAELPATEHLRQENIFVITKEHAVKQDIRELRILILNLMPDKIITELQLARLLGNTPLQVQLELIYPSSHLPQNTPKEHLLSFYKNFAAVKDDFFDGLVITGAPVELLPYEEVDYWPELCEIMEWSKTHVTSTLHICWSSQAALYYHFGLDKQLLPEKLFGVYKHTADYKKSILLRGFDDTFWVPHSRHTTVNTADIAQHTEIKILASSSDAGVYIASTKKGRQIFVMGHAEYDGNSLYNEYLRDKEKALDIALPENYFPNDDATQEPYVNWRGHANLLFCNWLNYYVYQATPYDIASGLDQNKITLPED